MTHRIAELQASPHWRAVDFVSDLHLQACDAATAEVWRRYLQTDPSKRAGALFILGDLFEVWIGDDVLLDPHSFASSCAALVRAYSQHTPVFFLHGNRDFLLGEAAAQAFGMVILEDPCVLELPNNGRCLLSHGDALCLDDTEYQQFRTLVRAPAWRTAFMSRSLQEREDTARSIRNQSEARKQVNSPNRWVDADAQAVLEGLKNAAADTLIHGHTHRPAHHDLGEGLSRIVLSDWDANALPPRAEVLRWNASGFQRLPV